MDNVWDDYLQEIKTEQIAFAFESTEGCVPFNLADEPIKRFVEKNFASKARFYDATIFLMVACTNDGFWKMLQAMDTTIILIANDITVENVEKAKTIFTLSTAFKTVIGLPIYGKAILVAEKYLPIELLVKVQKFEEKADPLFFSH